MPNQISRHQDLQGNRKWLEKEGRFFMNTQKDITFVAP